MQKLIEYILLHKMVKMIDFLLCVFYHNMGGESYLIKNVLAYKMKF